MLSEGGWGGTPKSRTCVPSFIKKEPVPSLLHPFTSHPSPHPCHASSLHLKHKPKIKRHLHVSFILFLSSTPSLVPVFHFGGFLSVYSSSLSLSLCLCMLLFLYKKKAILSCFSESVILSVCLCPCGRLPGCLAAGGKWGHPVGDLIRRTLRGDALALIPSGPNRRGLVLLSFSSHSFCLCVSLCVIIVPSVYPPAKM